MIFLDTETCGLVGPIILIQHAEGMNSPVILHHVWDVPVQDTLNLLEELCNNDICAFNLSYDWFHSNKLYNLFINTSNKRRPPRPEEIAEISMSHPGSYCLKPKSVLDLFLVLRKSKWQVLMDRRPIRIKRVPVQLAQPLALLLKERIKLSKIFFHFRPNQEYKWEIDDSKDGFADIILKFAASSGLKAIMKELFDEEVIDGLPPKWMMPEEDSYNPYDTRWQDVIQLHIDWWKKDEPKIYAINDIKYLRRLYSYLNCPAFGDTDSVLAACVGAVRWRGYAVDADKIGRRLLKLLLDQQTFTGCNFNSPVQSKEWLLTSASELEQTFILDTSKKTLDILKEWQTDVGHRARQIIKFRTQAKEIDVLRKLARTKRFNPDFKVIGAKSGRMSGGSDSGITGGSLNPQGIKRNKEFRNLYTLAENNDVLSGGDFAQFEVTIADATYNDTNLRRCLRAGKSFPAILGELLYNEKHDEILASKGTDIDHYTPSKNTTYGLFYGALEPKLAEIAGVSEETTKQALEFLYTEHPSIRKNREFIFDQFCSMRQPLGLGHEIIWREPADFIESLLGFRRYFTLENNITRTLFELANRLPMNFNIGGLVKRRDRMQTPRGATQSALFATAFQIQAQNMRAACNHVIQSTGAEITKELQRAIWNLQPCGLAEWRVQPMNIHDEVMCVHHPSVRNISEVVQRVVEKYKKIVPLLKIDWETGLANWGEK